MTKKSNNAVSWFVQSYYKSCAATAILSDPIIDQTQNSMTLCKVILYGLKPSDISYSSNDKITEVPFNNHHQQQEHLFTSDLSTHREEGTPSPETNYLNLQIKPLATPTYSRSLFNGDTTHESSPIRVIIHKTPRGRHRICVSQSLLRTHNSDA